MAFLELWNGTLINCRYIRKARLSDRRNKDDKMRDTIVTLDDGEQITIRGNYLAEIAAGAAIIPTTAGFLSIRYWASDDDGPGYVEKHPIIAWRIDHTGITAITADWSANDEDRFIQYPDGSVIDPGDRAWDNEAAWLQDMKKKEAAEKAEVAGSTS